MASIPRPLEVDVDVVENSWVKEGVPAIALAVGQMPPSFAVFVPLSQRIIVLPLASLGSKTRLLTFRFPVHGESKQPSMPLPLRTPILVATTEAGLAVALVSL